MRVGVRAKTLACRGLRVGPSKFSTDSLLTGEIQIFWGGLFYLRLGLFYLRLVFVTYGGLFCLRLKFGLVFFYLRLKFGLVSFAYGGKSVWSFLLTLPLVQKIGFGIFCLRFPHRKQTRRTVSKRPQL